MLFRSLHRASFSTIPSFRTGNEAKASLGNLENINMFTSIRNAMDQNMEIDSK